MYGSSLNGYYQVMRVFLFILAALLIAAPAWADEDDHDRARRALERGEILPLVDILKKAEQTYGGQLIEAEFDDEDGRMVYELVVLNAKGRVLKLYYDARSGEFLKMKERGKNH